MLKKAAKNIIKKTLIYYGLLKTLVIFAKTINFLRMKWNILVVIVLLGIACSSPAAKENTKTQEDKTETASGDSKKDTKTESSSGQNMEESSMPVRKGEVDMEFQINGLNAAGETVDLIGMYMDKKYRADSVTIQTGGKMVIKKDELFPDGFYYMVLPGDIVVKLLLDEDQTFKMTADASDVDHTAKIDGSLTMKLFYDDFNFKQDIDRDYVPIVRKISGMSPKNPDFDATYKQFLAISNKYEDRNKWLQKKYPDNFFTKFKIGGKNPILKYPVTKDGELDVKKQVADYRAHFWDGFDFNETGIINTPAFPNKLKRYFTELVPQNPDSIIKYTDVLVDLAKRNSEYFKVITNWVALKYEPGKTKLMDGEAVYSHVILKYFTPEKAKWLDEVSLNTLRKRAGEMSHSLVGQKAGDVTARGYGGKVYNLYSIKAPVIIVYIYNPDCSHCEEETPKLIQFYNKWKNKGVEIFSIAANTTEPEWHGFHDRFNLPWIDVFDASNASWYPKYFVDITPEMYVLDKNRKIFAKNLHVNQLETIMQKINK